MSKYVVCFAPCDASRMRRRIKKVCCTVDHWEVGKPFPPHVHIQSRLKPEAIAKALGLTVVIFKAASDPDTATKSRKKASARPYRDAEYGLGYSSDQRYNPDSRLADVGSGLHAHLFRTPGSEGSMSD